MRFRRKISYSLLVVVFCTALPGVGIAQNNELSFPLPSKPMVAIGNKMFCESIIGTFAEANAGNSIGGVRGTILKGTDKLAVEVVGENLHILTRQGFEMGDTRDESPFDVLVNTDESLLQ